MASSSTPLTETSAFTANVYPPQANSGIASNDIAAPLQALANRTKWLRDEKSRVYYHPTPDTDGAPSYTNATTVYTDIAAVQFADPATEEVAVGDVVELHFTGTFTNSTEVATVILAIQEASDPSPVAITAAKVRIPIGGVEVPVSLFASFVVTEAGTLIAAARGAKSIVGGTLTAVESFRLEAKVVRPTG
jgi:hypothetical protein